VFFLAMFAGDGDALNPFKLIFASNTDESVLHELMWLGAYGVGAGVIAPIYTACGFTLYLNRRASLEAWDLEIQLRQITRPAAVKPRPFVAHTLSLFACALLVALAAGTAPDAQAAATLDPAAVTTCTGPTVVLPTRTPAAGPAQTQARKLIDQVYAHPDLRGFECVQVWQLKEDKNKKKKKDKKKDDPDMPDLPQLNFLAALFKIVFIALAIAGVAFLLYRYRDHFPAFRRAPAALRATEVGGLDIRAESLPPEVTDEVRALWQRGERRLALALLYRATLSRLVSDDALLLRQGYTEGDCLRAATGMAALPPGRLHVLRGATTLWLNGAYGDRWPDSATVDARCAEWDAQFGVARKMSA
jgi:hypothetical protein